MNSRLLYESHVRAEVRHYSTGNRSRPGKRRGASVFQTCWRAEDAEKWTTPPPVRERFPVVLSVNLRAP